MPASKTLRRAVVATALGVSCAGLMWARRETPNAPEDRPDRRGLAKDSALLRSARERRVPVAPALSAPVPPEPASAAPAGPDRKAEQREGRAWEPQNTLAGSFGDLRVSVHKEPRDPSWARDTESFIGTVLDEELPASAVRHMECGERRCELSVSELSARDLKVGPRRLVADLTRELHKEFGAVRIFQSRADGNGVYSLEAIMARRGFTVDGDAVTAQLR